MKEVIKLVDHVVQDMQGFQHGVGGCDMWWVRIGGVLETRGTRYGGMSKRLKHLCEREIHIRPSVGKAQWRLGRAVRRKAERRNRMRNRGFNKAMPDY